MTREAGTSAPTVRSARYRPSLSHIAIAFAVVACLRSQLSRSSEPGRHDTGRHRRLLDRGGLSSHVGLRYDSFLFRLTSRVSTTWWGRPISSDLEGWIVGRSVGEGELIDRSVVIRPGAGDGLRTMSIPVAAEHAAGATLVIGDRVDVISMVGDEPVFVASDLEVVSIADTTQNRIVGCRSLSRRRWGEPGTGAGAGSGDRGRVSGDPPVHRCRGPRGGTKGEHGTRVGSRRLCPSLAGPAPPLPDRPWWRESPLAGHGRGTGGDRSVRSLVHRRRLLVPDAPPRPKRSGTGTGDRRGVRPGRRARRQAAPPRVRHHRCDRGGCGSRRVPGNAEATLLHRRRHRRRLSCPSLVHFVSACSARSVGSGCTEIAIGIATSLSISRPHSSDRPGREDALGGAAPRSPCPSESPHGTRGGTSRLLVRSPRRFSTMTRST